MGADRQSGPRYRVVWERVQGHAKNEALIRAIQNANVRRNRHERRVWSKLTLQAIRLGLLERAEDLPTA